MRLPPETQGLRWLMQAGQDLEAARILAASGHCNLACFHAQQAAEKAAKAFLYAQGLEEVWGHSVAVLLRDAASFRPELADLRPTGAALDKFYITTRYPNGLPDGVPADAYTEPEASDAIAKASTIIAAVRQRLPRQDV